MQEDWHTSPSGATHLPVELEVEVRCWPHAEVDIVDLGLAVPKVRWITIDAATCPWSKLLQKAQRVFVMYFQLSLGYFVEVWQVLCGMTVDSLPDTFHLFAFVGPDPDFATPGGH